MVQLSPRRKSSKMCKSRRKSKSKTRRKSESKTRRRKSSTFKKKSNTHEVLESLEGGSQSSIYYNEPCPSETPLSWDYPQSPFPSPPPWAKGFPPDLYYLISHYRLSSAVSSHPKYNHLQYFYSLMKRKKAIEIMNNFKDNIDDWALIGHDRFLYLDKIGKSFARFNIDTRDNPDMWPKEYLIAYLGCIIIYNIYMGNTPVWVIEKLKMLYENPPPVFTENILTKNSIVNDIYNFLDQFKKEEELDYVGI